jgi:hypothetical protein
LSTVFQGAYVGVQPDKWVAPARGAKVATDKMPIMIEFFMGFPP